MNCNPATLAMNAIGNRPWPVEYQPLEIAVNTGARNNYRCLTLCSAERYLQQQRKKSREKQELLGAERKGEFVA